MITIIFLFDENLTFFFMYDKHYKSITNKICEEYLHCIDLAYN